MGGKLSYTSLEEFDLIWRFTDPKYAVWPAERLEKILPLSELSARNLDERIAAAGLNCDPYSAEHSAYLKIDESGDGRDPRVRSWLAGVLPSLKQNVFASWSTTLAAETSWELILEFWDDFYYPMSDDLTVCDASLRWAILFHHEGEIFFWVNPNK